MSGSILGLVARRVEPE